MKVEFELNLKCIVKKLAWLLYILVCLAILVYYFLLVRKIGVANLWYYKVPESYDFIIRMIWGISMVSFLVISLYTMITMCTEASYYSDIKAKEQMGEMLKTFRFYLGFLALTFPAMCVTFALLGKASIAIFYHVKSLL